MFNGLSNQRGFATLEVILMITVLGILSAIAIPRFTAVTTAANTVKIQSDLTTIDTAIAVYQMENGKDPSNNLSDLKDYIQDVDNLKPPTGSMYVEGNEQTISATSYSISSKDGAKRATLDNHTAGEITKTKKSST